MSSNVKIEEALEILKAIGMPRGQLNERTALCLLALVNVGPKGSWKNSEQRLIGITPMMEFADAVYGKKYKPNSRETFRRFSMHQLVDAGFALYNPDDPKRPVNSPKAVYQISTEGWNLVQFFGTTVWKRNLKQYLGIKESLATRYAAERKQVMVPVQIEDNKQIEFSAGKHSELMRDIIEEFAPRFIPNSKLVYAGDTGAKWSYFNEQLLGKLGVRVDSHGKMPDVVLYFPKKKWLILAESVTSHGPVDPKRRVELKKMFLKCKVGLVFVTAFPTKKIMNKYISDVAWETEVWVAEAPSHLMHLNGVRFLGPYE